MTQQGPVIRIVLDNQELRLHVSSPLVLAAAYASCNAGLGIRRQIVLVAIVVAIFQQSATLFAI